MNKQVEESVAVFKEARQAVLQSIFDTIVLPCLKRYRWRIRSGNGAYIIVNKKGDILHNRTIDNVGDAIAEIFREAQIEHKWDAPVYWVVSSAIVPQEFVY